MYKIIAIALLTSIAVEGFSQIGFEKGYFVNNDGSRTECYIKNVDWAANPKEFTYTLQQGGESLNAQIENIQEFGVGNSKYLKATVDVDVTVSDPARLTVKRAPEWVNETVLLKVLVEGNADLFYYRRKGEDRYFYRVESRPITQLVYKLYRGPENRAVSNNTFQNQLKTDVNCLNYPDSKLKQLRYNSGTLIDFFIRHNECLGDNQTKTPHDTTRTLFRLKITPGVDFAKAHINFANGNRYVDLEPSTGFRIGADLELVLPFNRNKWSIMIEPTYQSYASQTKNNKTKVDYKSIEIPVGLRHYFFLNSSWAIFLNVAGVVDLPLDYTVTAPTIEFESKHTSIAVMGGAGVTFKRFSIEGRYYPNRTFIDNDVDPALFHYYQKSSIILGYRIIK